MRAKPCPVSVEQETRFSEGYDQLLPTLLAMPSRHLPRVNLNILDAVITVLGVLPRLMALREQLVQALPQFNRQHLDMLEVYAKALAHADLICRGFPEECKELPKVIAAAFKLRDRLRADAIPLAKRGLLDQAALRAYRGTSAYTVIATDLQVLATLMRGNWASIENRCAVSRTELDQADRLAARIFRLAGTRDDKTPWLIRDRAFQLFVKAYSEVRSAVIWLRREEGDADKIAPSLYRKHRRSRVRQEQEPSHNPAPQGPEAAPRGPTEAPSASTGSRLGAVTKQPSVELAADIAHKEQSGAATQGGSDELPGQATKRTTNSELVFGRADAVPAAVVGKAHAPSTARQRLSAHARERWQCRAVAPASSNRLRIEPAARCAHLHERSDRRGAGSGHSKRRWRPIWVA